MKEQTRALFITHSYPAINSANSLGVEKIIQARPKFLSVCVLCYRFPGQEKEEEVDGVKVYRIEKDWFWPIEARSRCPGKVNQINLFLTRFVTRVRQCLYLPYFPLYDVAGCSRLAKAGKKIVKSEGVDAVFADFNGADTLLAGYKICQKAKAEFYPIFWDCLYDGFRSKYVTRRFNDRKKLALEIRIIKASSKTIMLEGDREKASSRYESRPDLFNKLAYIEVPYLDVIRDDWEPKNNGKLIFIYGGAIRGRNLEPLLNCLSEINLPIEFDVYSERYNDAPLLSLKKKYPFLRLAKPLPTSSFVQRCLKSDYLVNFGVSNASAISSKIFLYFSTCKPVISTCPIKNEASKKYVERYPLGHLFDEKEPDLQSLKDFLTTAQGKKADPKVVEKEFRQNDPHYFWRLLVDEK